VDPKDFYAEIVNPSLSLLAGLVKIPVSDAARVLTMTIAGQESNWAARRQIGGPARSYWQFEQGGGVAGLFHVTPHQLAEVCKYFDVPFDIQTVFEAMAWHDPLACCMARLLLFTDAAPLPAVGEVDQAWSYYQRTWRPGAPHPEFWAQKYAFARALL
jgi:hypothetical protein